MDFDAPERTLTTDRTRAQATRQEFEQDVAWPGAVGLGLRESIGLAESPAAGGELVIAAGRMLKEYNPKPVHK